jgi:hypothetical protein
MKLVKNESDRAVVVCSHCGHKFVIDVAQFIADDPDYGANPTYLTARCPECFFATTVNIVNPMSASAPVLRTVQKRSK